MLYTVKDTVTLYFGLRITKAPTAYYKHQSGRFERSACNIVMSLHHETSQGSQSSSLLLSHTVPVFDILCNLTPCHYTTNSKFVLDKILKMLLSTLQSASMLYKILIFYLKPKRLNYTTNLRASQDHRASSICSTDFKRK